jgi:hypothetical protein
MDGFITLTGVPRAGMARQWAQRRTLRAQAATDPEYAGQDVAPRPTVRQEAFDYGDEPLPGYSVPPPRRTGWERER